MFVGGTAKGVGDSLRPGLERAAWLHVFARNRGERPSNCKPGDAAAVSGEEKLALTGVATEPSEILLFDLA